MISLGCRGLGIIFNLDIENQRKLFNFGAHLGIAFQIHDDILDFTQDSRVLGKPAFNDVKEGIVTAPLVFGLLQHHAAGNMDEFREMNDIILRKFDNQVQDVPRGIDLLFSSSGIELADKLSIEHILSGIDSLQQMEYPNGHNIIASTDGDENHVKGLVGLALKVKTRKY